MDEDVEMPELPPEVKINMKLDDIIKYNKIRGGVSHNLQFNRRGKWRQSDRKFRPYFKRRYPSQNWRLRGNGPNTPRFRRYQFGHQHMGRIRAFLERKWRTTPFNSVFQRLGRNPLQESAQAKVWNARNYYRPQRPHFSFLKKFNHKPIYDPNRGKKLTQSYRHYSSQLGDGLGGLSEVKVEKLNEAIGGQVTSVEEEEPEPGFVVTTIYSQRAPSSAMNSSFEDVNAMSSNSYHHARPDRNGPINGNAMSSNGYQYANPDWNGPMNGNAMSSNGHNYASQGPNGPMNGLARNPYATNPMTMNGINRSDIAISMNGGRPLFANNASNGSGNFSASFDEHSGHQNSGHFNGNGSQGNLMNGGVHAHSGLSRSVNNLNEQQLIQRLNQQRLPNDNDSVPSTSNYGRGIDQSVCIHSTNRSITSRFGGPTTTFAVIDSLKSS